MFDSWSTVLKTYFQLHNLNTAALVDDKLLELKISATLRPQNYWHTEFDTQLTSTASCFDLSSMTVDQHSSSESPEAEICQDNSKSI